jgi:hypothetical protein
MARGHRLGAGAGGLGGGGRARRACRRRLGARVSAADSNLATRPGVVGYVLRDRETGAVYRNAHAADPVWTASTIKLAAMLHSSDDDAADALWSRYGGADHQAYNSTRGCRPAPTRRPRSAVGRLGCRPGDDTGQ